MKKSLLFIAFISFFVITTTVRGQDEYNKGEVFTGYSMGFYLDEPPEHGFNAAAVYNFHKYIGIKGDVSGTYKPLNGQFYLPNSPQTSQSWKGTHNLYNVAAGVQFKDNRTDSTVKPFGHIMVGYAKHFDNFNTPCPTGAVCPPFNIDSEGVSFLYGGGLDIRVNDKIDIRAVQFDVNTVSSTTGRDFINPRFSAGVVFKF